MDALDLKLLEDLTSDGRTSYAELGRKYGLTRVSIKERIDKQVVVKKARSGGSTVELIV